MADVVELTDTQWAVLDALNRGAYATEENYGTAIYQYGGNWGVAQRTWKVLREAGLVEPIGRRWLISAVGRTRIEAGRCRAKKKADADATPEGWRHLLEAVHGERDLPEAPAYPRDADRVMRVAARTIRHLRGELGNG